MVEPVLDDDSFDEIVRGLAKAMMEDKVPLDYIKEQIEKVVGMELEQEQVERIVLLVEIFYAWQSMMDDVNNKAEFELGVVGAIEQELKKLRFSS